MHPIERLRVVARAAGAGPALLAREAAGALAAFGDDPAGLVTACRRLVDRQPTSGPMWWLAARVLGAGDPTVEAWRAADDVDAGGRWGGAADRLTRAGLDAVDVPESGLAAAVTASSLLLLEASALGPGGFVATAGSHAAAAVARHAGVEVWVVAGVGRVLPGRLWEALVRRLEDDGEPWLADDELVPLDL